MGQGIGTNLGRGKKQQERRGWDGMEQFNVWTGRGRKNCQSVVVTTQYCYGITCRFGGDKMYVSVMDREMVCLVWVK